MFVFVSFYWHFIACIAHCAIKFNLDCHSNYFPFAVCNFFSFFFFLLFILLDIHCDSYRLTYKKDEFGLPIISSNVFLSFLSSNIRFESNSEKMGGPKQRGFKIKIKLTVYDFSKNISLDKTGALKLSFVTQYTAMLPIDCSSMNNKWIYGF